MNQNLSSDQFSGEENPLGLDEYQQTRLDILRGNSARRPPKSFKDRVRFGIRELSRDFTGYPRIP